MFSKVLLCFLCCLFVSCAKKGPYGFKTGQKYTYYEDDTKIHVKVVDAGEDYVIFRNQECKPGDPGYNSRWTKDALRKYCSRFILK